jgi:GT2 family glycosyltransferase
MENRRREARPVPGGDSSSRGRLGTRAADLPLVVSVMNEVDSTAAKAPADSAPTAALSILIVNWNTRDETRECLDSIPLGFARDIDYEVVVVDNGSLDGSVEMLAARDDVTFIRNDGNFGFARGVNQAYAVAHGERILLLNSDVELTPGSVTTLMAFLDQHSDVAGVGPVYLYPDGTHQDFHFRFPTFRMTLAVASSVLRRLRPFSREMRRYFMLDDDFSAPRQVDQPSASCLLLRREAIPPGPLLDEAYPIFFNDVDLARRLRDRGHELWVTPDAVVYHERGGSTRLLGQRSKRQYVASVVRYLRATEPWHRVFLYRSLVFLQGLFQIATRNERALPLRELWCAVGADPGVLPRAPVRQTGTAVASGR